MSRPFRESWTQAHTHAVLDHHHRRPEEGEASPAYPVWRAEWSEHRAHLMQAVEQHLLWLAGQGRLGLPPHAEAVDLRWLHEWRRLVNGTQAKELYHLPRMFASMLGLRMVMLDVSNAASHHEDLVQAMETGDFDDFELATETCEVSGLLLSVSMEHWQPTLHVQGDNYTVTALHEGQIRAPGVEHVTMNLPSGELWFANWFGIPAVERILNEMKEAEKMWSINTARGCELQTKAYAALGLGWVFAGDNSPEVIEGGGQLRIGIPDWDDDGEAAPLTGTSLGHVCTDIWCVSFIDKQTLVDLVARSMSPQEALDEVERWASEHDVIKTQVAPGEHHLYFAAHPTIFQACFKSAEVSWEGFQEPMFVLSARELTLDATPRLRGLRH